MVKKILSKKEFIEKNKKMASKMSRDRDLQKNSIKIFTKADSYRWVHQTTWMGEPVLNLPHAA